MKILKKFSYEDSSGDFYLDRKQFNAEFDFFEELKNCKRNNENILFYFYYDGTDTKVERTTYQVEKISIRFLTTKKSKEEYVERDSCIKDKKKAYDYFIFLDIEQINKIINLFYDSIIPSNNYFNKFFFDLLCDVYYENDYNCINDGFLYDKYKVKLKEIVLKEIINKEESNEEESNEEESNEEESDEDKSDKEESDEDKSDEDKSDEEDNDESLFKKIKTLKENIN